MRNPVVHICAAIAVILVGGALFWGGTGTVAKYSYLASAKPTAGSIGFTLPRQLYPDDIKIVDSGDLQITSNQYKVNRSELVPIWRSEGGKLFVRIMPLADMMCGDYRIISSEVCLGYVLIPDRGNLVYTSFGSWPLPEIPTMTEPKGVWYDSIKRQFVLNYVPNLRGLAYVNDMKALGAFMVVLAITSFLIGLVWIGVTVGRSVPSTKKTAPAE